MVGYRMLPSSKPSPSPITPAPLESPLEKAFLTHFSPLSPLTIGPALLPTDVALLVGEYLKQRHLGKTLVSLMRVCKEYHEGLKGVFYEDVVVAEDSDPRKLCRIGIKYRKLIKTFRVGGPIPKKVYDMTPPWAPRMDKTYTTHLFAFLGGCYNLRDLDLRAVMVEFFQWPVMGGVTAKLPLLTTFVQHWDAWAPEVTERVSDSTIPFPGLKHATIILTGSDAFISRIKEMRARGEEIVSPNRKGGWCYPIFKGPNVAHTLIMEDYFVNDSLQAALYPEYLYNTKEFNLIVPCSHKWPEHLCSSDLGPQRMLMFLQRKESVYLSYIIPPLNIERPIDLHQFLGQLMSVEWEKMWEQTMRDELLAKLGYEEQGRGEEYGELDTVCKDFRVDLAWPRGYLKIGSGGPGEGRPWSGAPALAVIDLEDEEKGCEIPKAEVGEWGKSMGGVDRMNVMMNYKYWDAKAARIVTEDDLGPRFERWRFEYSEELEKSADDRYHVVRVDHD